MANLSKTKKYGKKPVLNFIIDPRNKTKEVGTLIANAKKLSTAKGDERFRYILRVELFAARDKDEWEFLKYQMKILKKMFHGMYPSSQTPLIRLIFTEHHTARADPNRPCSDILSRARMMDYLKSHEARGDIRDNVFDD
ncbi:hypothetical protein MMC31_007985 [Peltigera leucophlebia]|nr:hypothetical protein [Peltigera leucophlebia]